MQSYLDWIDVRADSEGLYVQWIGGNDLAAALDPATVLGVAYNSAAAVAV